VLGHEPRGPIAEHGVVRADGAPRTRWGKEQGAECFNLECIGIECLFDPHYLSFARQVVVMAFRRLVSVWCLSEADLHDDAPAGLVTAAAVARLTALGGWRRLDDGGDGGGDAGRHVCSDVDLILEVVS
jgi:hypothetical protein